MRCSMWLLLMAVAHMAAGPVAAQSVRGLTWNLNSDRAVGGVGVAAVNMLSDTVAATTTDGLGAFRLDLPAPGRYRLVVLGAATMERPFLVDVADGGEREVLLEVALASGVGELMEGPATALVMGRVVDATTQRPIPDVKVSIEGARAPVTTRWDGRFWLDQVPTGDRTISIDHLSYEERDVALRVAADSAYDVTVPLSARPIELPGIEVAVRSRATARLHRDVFFRLDRDLGGTFLTRDDLRRRGNPPVGQVLEGLPSSRVRQGCAFGCPLPPGFHVTLRGGCQPTIYVDGVRFARASDPQAVGEALLMSSGEVEIIEVYPSPASLPAEYNDPGTFCAIGIWTRRGGGDA